MIEEFDKWWRLRQYAVAPNFYSEGEHSISKAAFIAGAAAGYANGVTVMKERCAEVAEKMTRECPSDQCPQYSDADDCMYKDTGYCIANAIRRLKI